MTHGVVLREDLPLLTPVGRGPIPGERLLEGRAFGLAHLTLVLGCLLYTSDAADE